MATILLVVTPRHDAWRCCLLAEGLRAAGHAVALEFFPQAERYFGHAAFRPLIDTEEDPEEPSLALVAPVSEALRSALTERRSARSHS